jgi:hypothetical protein
MQAEYTLLRRAVQQRQVVRCIFKGLERELYPQALGLKGGRAHLLAWQIGGRCWEPLSADGGWRCIPIYQMTDLAITDGQWRVASTPAPTNMCLDLLDVQAPGSSVAA